MFLMFNYLIFYNIEDGLTQISVYMIYFKSYNYVCFTVNIINVS